MQLQMDWPPTGLRFPVPESDAREHAVIFCLSTQQCVACEPEGGDGFLRIQWDLHEPTVVIQSATLNCLMDGQRLQNDKPYPLRLGSMLQAGMMSFSVISAAKTTVTPPQDHLEVTTTASTTLPELEALLGQRGNYTLWQAHIEQSAMPGDVLKNLAAEYKHYLLWGDQNRSFIAQGSQSENRLPARDPYLETLTESVKDKTLIECIFNEGALIDRVLTGLMTFNHEELPEEVQPDILTALAPEHFSRIERREVSELLYRELYKLGLDSHL